MTPLPKIDRRRIRIGLAVVSVVFLVSLVLSVIVEDNLGQLVMGAVAATAALRAALLVRSLRRDDRDT